jgi:hypothetical protein
MKRLFIALILLLIAIPCYGYETGGTFLDNQFDDGTSGNTLASPPWSDYNTCATCQYSHAYPRTGSTMEFKLLGSADAGFRGTQETTSVDAIEYRFWVYFLDTTTDFIVWGDAGASTYSIFLYFKATNTIDYYVDGTGWVNIADSTYSATTWTEYKIVQNFTNHTYALSYRTSIANAWTSIKSDIPMRTNTASASSGSRWVSANNDTVYIDSIQYSETSITDYSIVTPSVGSNGSMSPSTAQNVTWGNTISFDISPNKGYKINSVSGCNGTLSGNIYTTETISEGHADCTVTASFSAVSGTEWLSSGGTDYDYRMSVPVANPSTQGDRKITVPFPAWFLRQSLWSGNPKIAQADYDDVHCTMDNGIDELACELNSDKNEIDIWYGYMPVGRQNLYIYYGHASVAAAAGDPTGITSTVVQIIDANAEVETYNDTTPVYYVWGENIDDTWLDSENPADYYGDETTATMGVSANAVNAHYLLKFMEGALPKGSVSSSTLYMYLSNSDLVDQETTLKAYRFLNEGSLDGSYSFVGTGWSEQTLSSMPTWDTRFVDYRYSSTERDWAMGGATDTTEVDLTDGDSPSMVLGVSEAVGYKTFTLPTSWIEDWINTDEYSQGVLIKDSTGYAESGTLSDSGFESGTAGNAFWAAQGSPTVRAYNHDLPRPTSKMEAKITARASQYDGAYTNDGSGMTSDNAEVRVWFHFDDETHFRGFYDSNYVTTIKYDTDGKVYVYTAKSGITGYTQDAYTEVLAGGSTSGYSEDVWTEWRIVINFTAETYTLSSRVIGDSSWTQYKSSGAADYNIPWRSSSSPSDTGAWFVLAYNEGSVWIDGFRYSDSGISDTAKYPVFSTREAVNSPVIAVTYTSLDENPLFNRKVTTDTYYGFAGPTQDRSIQIVSENSFAIFEGVNGELKSDLYYINEDGRISRASRDNAPASGRWNSNSAHWGLYYDTVTYRYWIAGNDSNGKLTLAYSDAYIPVNWTFETNASYATAKSVISVKNDVVYCVFWNDTSSEVSYITYTRGTDTWGTKVKLADAAVGGTMRNLDAAIEDTDTAPFDVYVDGDVTDYSDFGVIRIDDERFWYDSKDDDTDTLHVTYRAIMNTEAADHTTGSPPEVTLSRGDLTYIQISLDPAREDTQSENVGCFHVTYIIGADTDSPAAPGNSYIQAVYMRHYYEDADNVWKDENDDALTLPLDNAAATKEPVFTNNESLSYLTGMLTFSNGDVIVSVLENLPSMDSYTSTILRLPYGSTTWTRIVLNELLAEMSFIDLGGGRVNIIGIYNPYVKQLLGYNNGITWNDNATILTTHDLAYQNLWWLSCSADANLENQGLTHYQHYGNHGAVYVQLIDAYFGGGKLFFGQ